MTTETTIAVKPTSAHLWQILKPIIFDEGAPPLSMRLHPNGIAVDIELPHNDRRAVDKAIEYLGMAPGFLHLDHAWDAGKPDEFRMYGHYYNGTATLLPGWGVQVYCHVYTQAEASAHWDGLSMRGSRRGHVCFDPACRSPKPRPLVISDATIREAEQIGRMVPATDLHLPQAECGCPIKTRRSDGGTFVDHCAACLEDGPSAVAS